MAAGATRRRRGVHSRRCPPLARRGLAPRHRARARRGRCSRDDREVPVDVGHAPPWKRPRALSRGRRLVGRWRGRRRAHAAGIAGKAERDRRVGRDGDVRRVAPRVRVDLRRADRDRRLRPGDWHSTRACDVERASTRDRRPQAPRAARVRARRARSHGRRARGSRDRLQHDGRRPEGARQAAHHVRQVHDRRRSSST